MANKAYAVCYKMNQFGDEHLAFVSAKNAKEAYDLAVYEQIPQEIGEVPYSAWVYSVTYNNGNYHRFNTCEGLPY